MEETKNEGSLGPIVGTIIILLVIILGGLYFWGERARKMNTLNQIPAEESQSEIRDITSQSSSDATADIEADLNATDIDSVDSGL